MNSEVENLYKALERLEVVRLKTEKNMVRLFEWFNSGMENNENETKERELALEKACTLLMRINLGFTKMEKINGKCNDSDKLTADQFLLYLMIDELKENDHNIQIETEPMPYSNSLYKRGYVGDAFVTHLIDQVLGICCIIDCESMPKLKGLFNQCLQPLEDIPEPREQFGYLHEGTMLFRVIRCDEFAPYVEGSFDIFLIDIGCKIKIDANKSRRHFFVLNDTVKSVSGFMRKCQIVNMPRDLNTLDLLHARIQYNIIFNDEKTVYINVLAENAQDFYGKQPDDQQNFYSYLWADSTQILSLKKYQTANISPETVSEAGSLPDVPVAKDVESFERNVTENQEKISATTFESIETNNIEKVRETIPESKPSKDKVAENTARTIAEPTENNCKHNETKVSTIRKTRGEIASLLYNSKEEDIKLLDMELPTQETLGEPNINRAPKQRLSKELKLDSHEKLIEVLQSCPEVPSIGTKMMVQATNVLNVSDFYGYNVKDESRYQQFFDSFNELFCKIDSQPQINDKILAIYENTLNRAVVTQISDVNLFQVFYLDFGHQFKVTSANIFKWDPSLDELPYRVLRFRINGIRPLFENDIHGVYGAQQLLLYSAIEATVVGVCDDGGFRTLIIDALDENGLDVAKTLKYKNLAASG